MKKSKIVVLTDLSRTCTAIIKSSISLAKIVNAEIEVFSVKKPADIVENANQLSAMRTINKEHATTERELQRLIAPFKSEFGVAIDYSFAFGNVKNEIEDFIERKQPDIIVLAKRKNKPFNLVGDGITNHLIKTFNGTMMIVSENSPLLPDKELNLGVLNNFGPDSNKFVENVMRHTHQPLKSFKIAKPTGSIIEDTTPESKGTIDFVFEQNDSTLNNLSKYLTKNNINLLFVDRGAYAHNNQLHLSTPNLKEVAGKLDITLLFTPAQTSKSINKKNSLKTTLI